MDFLSSRPTLCEEKRETDILPGVRIAFIQLNIGIMDKNEACDVAVIVADKVSDALLAGGEYLAC